MIRLAACALLGLALMAAAPAADAAVVAREGAAVVFTAAPGEANFVSVRYEDDEGAPFLGFVDQSAPLSAGAGCEPFGGSVRCVAAGVSDVRVVLGDGDDNLHFGQEDEDDVYPMPLAAAGGEGNDDLDALFVSVPVTLAGEGADDRLQGGTADDRLDGGDGADVLNLGPGRDVAFGGEGDDLIEASVDGPDQIACGGGRDETDGDTDDSVANDCERQTGIPILPVDDCIPFCTTPGRRLSLSIGTPSTPGSVAGRDAKGTLVLRTLHPLRPRGGGAKRKLRLGRVARFSVERGERRKLRYRLNGTAMRLLRTGARKGLPLPVEFVVRTRNPAGFRQREIPAATQLSLERPGAFG